MQIVARARINQNRAVYFDFMQSHPTVPKVATLCVHQQGCAVLQTGRLTSKILHSWLFLKELAERERTSLLDLTLIACLYFRFASVGWFCPATK